MSPKERDTAAHTEPIRVLAPGYVGDDYHCGFESHLGTLVAEGLVMDTVVSGDVVKYRRDGIVETIQIPYEHEPPLNMSEEATLDYLDFEVRILPKSNNFLLRWFSRFLG